MNIKLPYYVEDINGILFCFLENEIDKNTFEVQCKKCPLKNTCITKQDHYKNVAGDWHSLNASGLYGDEFDKCTDKIIRKDLRSIAKIVGLAVCYGGAAYTIAGNMRTSQGDAQIKLDNFLKKLTTLNIYMLATKKRVLETGMAYNIFGRKRDMSRWAFSKSWKDKSFAQRVALNHPIQSTSAELLKIMMIRVDEYIESNNLSPTYGLTIKQHIDPDTISYRDFILHELMSTHDEIDFLFHQEYVDRLTPEIYEIMQIQDVIDAFNIGFSLELDCEFDPKNRSLLPTASYMNSKIHIINKMRKNQILDIRDKEPNTILIGFDKVDLEFVEALSGFVPGENDTLYDLMVDCEEGIYQHGSKFTVNYIQSLCPDIKMAYVE